MSEAEWAAIERQRLDQERVLERITVKRRVYSPTPTPTPTRALARQWRWMMRLAWLDARCQRGGWVCGAMIDLLWRRLDR